MMQGAAGFSSGGMADWDASQVELGSAVGRQEPPGEAFYTNERLAAAGWEPIKDFSARFGTLRDLANSAYAVPAHAPALGRYPDARCPIRELRLPALRRPYLPRSKDRPVAPAVFRGVLPPDHRRSYVICRRACLPTVPRARLRAFARLGSPFHRR